MRFWIPDELGGHDPDSKDSHCHLFLNIHLLVTYLLNYLNDATVEKRRERKRFFHPLVPSPNGCCGQGCVCHTSSQGSHPSVPHWWQGPLYSVPSCVTFPDTFLGQCSSSSVAVTRLNTQIWNSTVASDALNHSTRMPPHHSQYFVLYLPIHICFII